ncbi:GGDEF domain-containing protein [Marinomonas foliarum]|uniref:diguanylate cyclase n=1 Tax=Marinomonas foliarum TaxID=491950 RepID=A0ABX7IT32_9GAMM|nr:GGDEF domain-containing protein [Marinomonas foliarum]QRV25146.1 GGDEF domain-containing protein [Marinomonas foliarum]
MVTTSQLKHQHPFTSNHVSNSLEQTTQILNITSAAGSIAHFIFIFLFIYLDQTTLAWLNVLSLGAWLLTVRLNRLKQHNISILIMSAEITVHAFFATSILGADAGFQYYLWPMTLLMMTTPSLNIIWSTAIALLHMATFALLVLLYPSQEEAVASYSSTLFIMNLICASIPFIAAAALTRLTYMSQYELMVKLAEKDELTKLFNRRFALEALTFYMKQQSKNGTPFCISLVDVDHFKQVNDQLGHNKGDEALIKISDYLSQSMRATDISSRWGGEEFLFIFPNVELAQIQQRIENICQDMPNNVSLEGWDKAISCSFGLIQIDANETVEDALKRVDDSLYQAKKNGRYQVVSDH